MANKPYNHNTPYYTPWTPPAQQKLPTAIPNQRGAQMVPLVPAMPIAPVHEAPPQIKPSDSVDLTAADPNCPYCRGQGYTGHTMVRNASGQMVQAQVACQCVAKRGGVEQNKTEEMLHKTAAALVDKNLAGRLAKVIPGLPPEMQRRVHAQLQARANSGTTDPRISAELNRALEILKKGGN